MRQLLGFLCAGAGFTSAAFVLSQHAADGRPAGTAATFLAVADKLLQALSGIDFGRVDIPLENRG